MEKNEKNKGKQQPPKKIEPPKRIPSPPKEVKPAPVSKPAPQKDNTEKDNKATKPKPELRDAET
jgi:hypothetical protein